MSAIGFCSPRTALDFAFSVTVSPDGKSAYVASELSNAVAVFDRAADGALTQKPGAAGCVGAGHCVGGTALDWAYSVTVSPDGKSAYVASRLSAAVAVFDRAADGTLTQKPGAAGCISDDGAGPCVDGAGLNGARSVTVSPDGESAYVASYNGGAVAVFDRAANGTLTQEPRTAGCISNDGAGPCVDGAALDGASSVTVSPDGKSAYVASFAALAVFDRGPRPLPRSSPPPAPVLTPVAAFAGSPKSLGVGSTGRFSYAFVATPLESGKISLKSTKKVKIGSKKRYMKLAAKAFTAPVTGNVAVTLQLSSKSRKALKRVGSLRFTVTVTLGGRSFTTKLKLKAPA